MKITYENIQNDVKFITERLKEKKMEIPSLWKVMRGGVALMLGMVFWQAIVSIYISLDNIQQSEDAYLSIAFTAVMGFIFFISYTSLMAKYLSLPLSVRESSLIFCFFKSKVKLYALSWVVINFIAGVIIVLMELNPFFLSGLGLLSVVLFVFLFSADMGRYNLFLFSSAISEWREQSK
jgi:hypothetical protein